LLKARVSLCKVEAPDIQTYRHFLTHIALCGEAGEISSNEIPTEFAKALSRELEVVILCTDTESLGEVISKYCRDVERDLFYIRLSPYSK
jgi:triphosphoribosyl-dephospho-CoA synthetase